MFSMAQLPGYAIPDCRAAQLYRSRANQPFFALIPKALTQFAPTQPLASMLSSNQEAAVRKLGRNHVLILARMRCFTVVSNSWSH
jgi:hypothetical protein